VSVFDDIKTGLNQAIEFEKGNLKAETKTLSVAPIEEFSASEIKNIRRNAGLTQNLFAKFLGVSVKTVESWESGRNQPSGAACRMLAITKKDPQFPKNSGIIMRS